MLPWVTPCPPSAPGHLSAFSCLHSCALSSMSYNWSHTECRLLRLAVVQLLGHVQLLETPETAAHQASLCFTISPSLLKLMSIESVMPSNHLILCHPLLLPPSIFPSIRVFSNELVLHIRLPEYWSFSFSISPSRTDGQEFRTDLL